MEVVLRQTDEKFLGALLREGLEDFRESRIELPTVNDQRVC